jgi:ribosomal protein L30/L7E
MEPRTKEQARAMLKTLGLLKTHRVLEGKEREKNIYYA